MFQVEAAVKMK